MKEYERAINSLTCDIKAINQSACKGHPHYKQKKEDYQLAIAALRTAQEREKPEPLSYPQYEALAEETCVFVVDGDGRTANALINSDGDCIDSDAGLWEQTYYGLKGDGYLGLHSVGWLAYHSRPEEG